MVRAIRYHMNSTIFTRPDGTPIEQQPALDFSLTTTTSRQCTIGSARSKALRAARFTRRKAAEFQPPSPNGPGAFAVMNTMRIPLTVFALALAACSGNVSIDAVAVDAAGASSVAGAPSVAGASSTAGAPGMAGAPSVAGAPGMAGAPSVAGAAGISVDAAGAPAIAGADPGGAPSVAGAPSTAGAPSVAGSGGSGGAAGSDPVGVPCPPYTTAEGYTLHPPTHRIYFTFYQPTVLLAVDLTALPSYTFTPYLDGTQNDPTFTGGSVWHVWGREAKYTTLMLEIGPPGPEAISPKITLWCKATP